MLHFADDIRDRLTTVAAGVQTRESAPRYRFTLFRLDRLFKSIQYARTHPNNVNLIEGCDQYYGSVS